MIPLSPSLFVASASTLIGTPQLTDKLFSEAETFRHAPLGADDEQWALHFLRHVGFRSHFDHRTRSSSWPLPEAALVSDLARDAEEAGVLSSDEPLPGDIFVLWSRAQRRHVRAGIVATVDAREATPDGGIGYACTTIECVAARVNSETTGTVLVRERRLMPKTGDRIVRWVDLDLSSFMPEAA